MGFQIKHTLKDEGKHKAKIFEKAKAKADKKGATITGNADAGNGLMDTFAGTGKAVWKVEKNVLTVDVTTTGIFVAAESVAKSKGTAWLETNDSA
jgi:hypothetical protein